MEGDPQGTFGLEYYSTNNSADGAVSIVCPYGGAGVWPSTESNFLSEAAETIGLAAAAAFEYAVNSLRKNDGRIYTVYFLSYQSGREINDFSSVVEIQYVGRVKTKNYDQRMAFHEKTRHLYPAFKIEGLTYEEARGLEEIGMLSLNSLRGVFPFNIIHGIAPTNPLGWLYSYDAANYIENKLSQDFLNLFDN